MALDVAGLSPGVGIIPDVINAVIYTIEGDFTNAGISGLSAIPLLGQVTTIGKYGGSFFKTTKEAVIAAKKLGLNKIGVHLLTAVFKQYLKKEIDITRLTLMGLKVECGKV
ncbi:hypothetical protein [Bathymodiolus thermophilus thioautotrophic gill symbiont]|uniref:Uncharacterized protein n=1 Tax=Bathymodiolus thermophilus thioautotrophic gill symbiont TaxID=2360 RepID=A0A1J5UL16_9GAMM|nr:hypothetical protein [Bathymodiolus thermophilus thioautotrophic gill symbiont]OIR24951.1 hypothetical protein BGC33_05000 [Bathymodiolus thermophilus thioautotrophic gill symbiont]